MTRHMFLIFVVALLCSPSLAWAGSKPSPDELAQAWQAALAPRLAIAGAQVQIKHVRGHIKGRCADWQIEIDPLTTPSPQAQALLRCANQRSPVRLRATLEVWVEAPMTTRMITRGEEVVGAVVWRRLSLWSLPADRVSDPAQLEGMISRQSLGANQVLRYSALEAPLVVARGQVVSLVVRRGAIMVTDRAEAMAAGRAGDWVMVRSVSTQKVLRAQVRADGALEVP